jgi:hypothetical protein
MEMGNEAFDHNGHEVARIFRKLADDLEVYDNLKLCNEVLFDVNGNSVGIFKVHK